MTPLVALALAALAPVADPPKKLVELYGEVADPKSKAVCELVKGDALQVTVPRSFAKDDDKPPTFLPPLTTKTVDGDFELTVRVRHTPPKDAGRPDGLKQPPTVWAGLTLHVEGDPNLYASLAQKHTLRDGKWVSRLADSANHAGGNPVGSRGGGSPDKPLYLRITREGDAFAFFSSEDGKKWIGAGRLPVKGFGSKVVVGPAVYQNTTVGYNATFDHYELKPLKAEKK